MHSKNQNAAAHIGAHTAWFRFDGKAVPFSIHRVRAGCCPALTTSCHPRNTFCITSPPATNDVPLMQHTSHRPIADSDSSTFRSGRKQEVGARTEKNGRFRSKYISMSSTKKKRVTEEICKRERHERTTIERQEKTRRRMEEKNNLKKKKKRTPCRPYSQKFPFLREQCSS